MHEGATGWSTPFATCDTKGEQPGRDKKAADGAVPGRQRPASGFSPRGPCPSHRAAGSLTAQDTPTTRPADRPPRKVMHRPRGLGRLRPPITREGGGVTEGPWTPPPTVSASNSSVIIYRHKVHSLRSYTGSLVGPLPYTALPRALDLTL